MPWEYLIPGHGRIIRKNINSEDTKNWLYFLDDSIRQALSQGDMVSEIFDYKIPESIKNLDLISQTLRQGIKKQLDLYKKNILNKLKKKFKRYHSYFFWGCGGIGRRRGFKIPGVILESSSLSSPTITRRKSYEFFKKNNNLIEKKFQKTILL